MAGKEVNCAHALIVGNGQKPSPALWGELMAEGPIVLCADGGANWVCQCGVVPHAVVGDLDSIEPSVRAQIPAERLVQVDADNTGSDVQKVLRYAVQMGVRAATLVGFTGGRSDHWLWNLSMLKAFAASIALRVIDDYCEVRLVSGALRLRAAVGQKISLTPLGGPVEGIETRGLRFALRGESLELGVRDGISNEVIDNPVEIRVERGDLLVVVQRQELRAPVEWEGARF